ncbi:DUF3649 domain-containing protein [Roseateles sp. 22389]|uniref:DUF3649 domain-containing protein n=1 Tax=Roseateles sp. 22389 TaxID=3453916 RepID=UPI003F85C791
MNVTVSPTPAARRVGTSRAGALARLRYVLPLLSRIVAAVGGGYALAALASVAVLALPVSRIQAVIGGMLGSFAVYVAAVVWVFAVRSATRAWIGLLVAALPLLPLAWSVWHGAAPAVSP